MTYPVKEAFKVKVYRIVVSLADYLLCFSQCMVTTAFGTEDEAVPVELTLIDRGQYLVDCLLDKAVYYRGDARLAHLAVILGYLYPHDWVRTERAVQ